MNAEEIIAQEYEQWLHSPITSHVIGKIQDWRDNLVKTISQQSADPNIDDATIRRFAYCLKNTDAILTLIKTKQ